MSDIINHTFNVEFANRYGIEESLIFGDIYYWCLRNKENEINKKKGSDGVERYYTFNSTRALQEIYSYMNIAKVYRVIEKLEKEGLIVTGCFNKRSGDRTRWYAVTEKGEFVFYECNKMHKNTLYDVTLQETLPAAQENSQFSNCNLQNETHNLQNETHNLQNETHNLQNETTLPNTNTYTNTNLNSYSYTEQKKQEQILDKQTEKKADVEALILNDDTEWQPSVSEYAEYVRLYPNVDIKSEFRRMRGWCIGNTKKRKTKHGIARFVNAWLGKEQDKPKYTQQSNIRNFNSPEQYTDEQYRADADDLSNLSF